MENRIYIIAMGALVFSHVIVLLILFSINRDRTEEEFIKNRYERTDIQGILIMLTAFQVILSFGRRTRSGDFFIFVLLLIFTLTIYYAHYLAENRWNSKYYKNKGTNLKRIVYKNKGIK